MRPPLTLHTPAHIDPVRNAIVDLNRFNPKFAKSIDVHGGSYRGRLSITGELPELETMFTRVGYEVREDGGRSFIGIIREMTLAHGGVTETVTLDDVANRVTATYLDGMGDEQTTAVAENTLSIARYGLYEKRLSTRLLQTEAEARRDTYLTGRAWPVPQVTGLRVGQKEQEAQLDIEVVGSSYEMRGRYLDINGEITGGTNTLSELVEFIATGCGFTVGRIEANTITWSEETSEPALAVLTKICELGGADGRPWLWWINRNRQLSYAPYPDQPAYFLHGSELRDRANRSVAGQERYVTTAVVRRMGVHRPARPGHWLPDGRDFYASRIEVSANNQLTLTADGYDEFALLEAQANIQRIEEEK